MESLKEKLGRGPKKLKEQKDSTNKELYPVFKEIENYKNRAEIIKKQFDKLGHREGEDFIFNEGVVKTDEEGDSYIYFMGKNYRINGLRGKLYEVGKDDNGEGFIYIGGTDSYNHLKWSGQSYIMRSNGFLFDGSRYLIGGKGVRFAPNGMIYDGNTSRGEPINPDEEDGFIHHLKGSYYELDGKKTTYEIIPGISEELNMIQDKTDAKDLMYKRGKVVETTVEEIGKTIEHSFSSWNEEIKFNEEDQDYVFRTNKGKELRIPREKGKDFIDSTADFINSAINLSKSEGFVEFKADNEKLTVSFKLKPRNTNILKNVKEKIGIDAKDFAQWLNDYVFEEKYKKYDTPKEKRGRPKKL